MSAIDIINSSSRLTIIPSDKTVYLDQGTYLELDLSECNIPGDVYVLQYKPQAGFGWIEFPEPDDPFTQAKQPNERITEIPQWAINCVEVWMVAHEAAQAAAPE